MYRGKHRDVKGVRELIDFKEGHRNSQINQVPP